MNWETSKQNPSIVIVNTSAKLVTLQDRLSKFEEVAIDTETDGIHRFRQVIGISFAVSSMEAYYIPIKIWNNTTQVLMTPWQNYSEIKKQIQAILSQSNKKWIGHNIQFDVIALRNTFEIDILPNVHADTMLLHHTCISEDPSHALKVLAAQFLDKEAASPQDDLKQSVILNGGAWRKDQKDMYRGDLNILGKYAGYDTIYTHGLYKLWYSEIEKQGLQRLWNEEVLPLIGVIAELNTTGICINVDYFKQLEVTMATRILEVENKLYADIAKDVEDYEYNKIVEELTITPRSVIGKYLLKLGLMFEEQSKVDEKGKTKKEYTPFNLNKYKAEIRKFYLEKNDLKRVFSLNSTADKAYLLFDVLNLDSSIKTKSGKNAVDTKTIALLMEEIEEGESNQSNEILKAIIFRSKQMKLLNTYVKPLLENQVEGRVYPQFNQVGTISGRFSSSDPINFQTLPRDNLEIKAGFIPDEGYVFVNADFSSLEPRCFAAVAKEPELKRVYAEGLDLYSHVYITLFKEHQYSARETDENYLKKLAPEKRRSSKEYTLGFAYKMSEYKLAKILNIPVEEAKDIKDLYFKNFNNLKQYQDSCDKSIKYKHYVSNIMGRKRRAKIIPFLQNHFKINVENPKEIINSFDRVATNPSFQPIMEALGMKHKKPKSGKDLAWLIKNEFNNASNFPIQSLAASIANASCIELQNKIKTRGFKSRLILQVHDEITVLSPKEEAEEVAKMLQESMELNKVTKMIEIPMVAQPLITDKSLAEAK